ncbi:MAG: glycosyltransferase, partial [Bacteroidota bacterium]
YGYDATVLPRNAAWRRAYAQLFGGASRLVGISNHICGLLHRLGAPPEGVSMVHLGVHLDQFPFAPPKARYQNGPVRCLHVGRLVEKKAPVHLVRAIGAAAPRVPAGLQLTIVGEGPLRQEVESEIERLGLSETVDLLGRVPHHEVKAQFQQAHLYTQHCLTAPDGDQEGQGVSFVEASATGLPVVATRHNGLVDVIEDGVTGHLVEEGDVDAMADRIVELANAPETWDAMGTAGRRRVEERFDAVAQAAHMLDLYRSVLS